MAHDALDKFTRQYGRLLMMMRRLVKEEFGVTVHLEEADAPQELLAFASRSRQHLLRQMMSELEDLLGEPSGSEQAENTEEEKITYYRGAPVVRQKSPDKTEEKKAPRSKRMYRGQEVT